LIWMPCERDCAEKDQYACRGANERAHEFMNERGAPGSKIIFAKCTNCGHLANLLEEEWLEAGRQMELRAQRSGASRAGLTKYPRIEPHTGALVNSRDDEVRAMKAFGMHAAPNGIDERYNDEACEKLKSARLERQKKKDELARRRRALGRAPAGASKR
jgi:hypothetical protein